MYWERTRERESLDWCHHSLFPCSQTWVQSSYQHNVMELTTPGNNIRRSQWELDWVWEGEERGEEKRGDMEREGFATVFSVRNKCMKCYCGCFGWAPEEVLGFDNALTRNALQLSPSGCVSAVGSEAKFGWLWPLWRLGGLLRSMEELLFTQHRECIDRELWVCFEYLNECAFVCECVHACVGACLCVCTCVCVCACVTEMLFYTCPPLRHKTCKLKDSSTWHIQQFQVLNSQTTWSDYLLWWWAEEPH